MKEEIKRPPPLDRLALAHRENVTAKLEDGQAWQDYLARAHFLHLRPMRFRKGSIVGATIYIGRFYDNIVALYQIIQPQPQPTSPVGYLAFRSLDEVLPFTDEEVAEEIVFKTDIAKMIEFMRRFYTPKGGA